MSAAERQRRRAHARDRRALAVRDMDDLGCHHDVLVVDALGDRYCEGCGRAFDIGAVSW